MIETESEAIFAGLEVGDRNGVTSWSQMKNGRLFNLP
jgi:hypothetical protein